MNPVNSHILRILYKYPWVTRTKVSHTIWPFLWKMFENIESYQEPYLIFFLGRGDPVSWVRCTNIVFILLKWQLVIKVKILILIFFLQLTYFFIQFCLVLICKILQDDIAKIINTSKKVVKYLKYILNYYI